MKKILIFLIIFFFETNVIAHTAHYKNFNKIEMDILKDGKKIGFCNYEFSWSAGNLQVKNITEFEVKIMGVRVFSIQSNGTEVYKEDKLTMFKSETIQNKKKKYVNLKFQKNDDNYLIDGSSYKGIASLNNVVGNWWNHKILTSKSQISPLSGSIKEQVVKFIKKENITINGKKYLAHKFTLKSKNPNLPEDKKLDFEIWLEPEKNIILKVTYNRLGNWEYILRKINFN